MTAGAGTGARVPHASALLPACDAARARPIRAWSAADRERVGRAIGDAARGWEEAWGLAVPCAEEQAATRAGIRAAPPSGAEDDFAGAHWHPLGDRLDGLWAALEPRGGTAPRGARGAEAAVARALFGDAPPRGAAGTEAGASRPTNERASGIAIQVAESAWTDWGRRVAASLGAAPGAPARGDAAPDPGELRPWSGALVVTLPWCGRSLSVLVGAERAARFLAPSPSRALPRAAPAGGLTPVCRVLERCTARLCVETQAVELELSALAALRVGDVLRTSHALDAPLHVNVEVGGRRRERLFLAYLGRSGGARAVELLPSPPAATAHAGSAAPGKPSAIPDTRPS